MGGTVPEILGQLEPLILVQLASFNTVNFTLISTENAKFYPIVHIVRLHFIFAEFCLALIMIKVTG